MVHCLIIDTSVVTSASDKKHDDEIESLDKKESPKKCSDFLNKFLQTENKLGLTQDLKTEWLNHQSYYTLKVLSKTKEERRIIKIKDYEDVEGVRQKVNNIKDKQRIGAILKDIHLLEAAILTDKLIISLDNKARSNFSHFYNCISNLPNVCWINPCDSQENALSWLDSKDKYSKERFLINHTDLKI
ncbi:hypothetical protein ACQJ0G_01300 [Bacillus altitudinis]|uniref:hypothetical protein n=1 Tax=Bacillus altitudinis TaxID=293387 RepID=UPI003CF01E7C